MDLFKRFKKSRKTIPTPAGFDDVQVGTFMAIIKKDKDDNLMFETDIFGFGDKITPILENDTIVAKFIELKDLLEKRATHNPKDKFMMHSRK